MKSPVLVCALILLAVLPEAISGRADEPAISSPNAIAAPITDPAQISAHYRQVLARPEFQETEEPDVNSRIKDWLSQWFMRLGAKFGQFKYASEMPVFASLLMTILVVLTVAGLLYLMVRLTRRRDKMDPEPSTEIPGQKMFRLPESYDEEIRQAIGAENWQAAWLTTWRQFLSRLENRRLVDADRTRTNREYLAQLRGKPLPGSTLALLTGMVDAYDRFIYGRQFIAEPDWNLFRQQIEEAGLLLHLDDKGARFRVKQEAP